MFNMKEASKYCTEADIIKMTAYYHMSKKSENFKMECLTDVQLELDNYQIVHVELIPC